MKQKIGLKQNLIRGESCNHQTRSKGEVFFFRIMIILYLMYMSILETLRGQKLYAIQEFNNALDDKTSFNLTVNWWTSQISQWLYSCTWWRLWNENVYFQGEMKKEKSPVDITILKNCILNNYLRDTMCTGLTLPSCHPLRAKL